MSDLDKNGASIGREQIGLLMHACDGELEIGQKALQSAFSTIGASRMVVQIVDDASKQQVGQNLAEFCQHCGAKAYCHRLDEALGYRGCISRTMKGLKLLADRSPNVRCIVKIDADTLIIDPGFGSFIDKYCAERNGLWGVPHTLRRRDLVLLLADLLPMGFRRKCVNGQVQRAWELSRALPVWWADIGLRALLRPQRIDRIATGGVYILAGPLLQKLSQRGYLEREIGRRYGFVTSEEDTMITLMAKACGGRLFDMNTIQSNFGVTQLPPDITAEQIIKAGYKVVHPLKNKEKDNLLRKRLTELLEMPAQSNSSSP